MKIRVTDVDVAFEDEFEFAEAALALNAQGVALTWYPGSETMQLEGEVEPILKWFDEHMKSTLDDTEHYELRDGKLAQVIEEEVEVEYETEILER